MIAENLESVTQRIARSCERAGRPGDSVRLWCVTKEAGLEEIEEILRLGLKDTAENRVQDALLKYNAIGKRASWHMVGHLQTNKVRDAVRIFSLIHSVDSPRLARAIDEEAKRIGKVQEILIQVNTSGEKTKFGTAPEEAQHLIKDMSLYENIKVKGLMAIAPETSDVEKIRTCFKRLKELLDKINSLNLKAYSLQFLSMGMTNDFEIAIEEGANIVRIGRAIFGEK